ncbi:Nsp1-like C-terminal region-domain-containing protein [Nemania serpens]|nr:Nsp1-like C-terminal region-domain-containing protein [Nemania serpens]
MSLFGAPNSSGQPNNNNTNNNNNAGNSTPSATTAALFGSSTTSTAAPGTLFGNQAKSTPTFSFGNAASGSGSAPSPFSGTPTTGSLFGNPGTGAKPAEQRPAFGATSAATPAASSTPSLGGGASGSLFGSSTLTPPTASVFGSRPAAASPASGASLFGNTPLSSNTATTSTTTLTPLTTTTTTAPTTTMATSAGSLFGQNSSAANQGTATNKPGGLFGGGSGTTGGSLFGGTNSNATSTTQATPPKPTFSLNSTTPAGAPPANNSKPPSGVSLFGATTAAPSTASPFASVQGEKRESQAPSLFASQASSLSKPATTQPSPSLFPAASQPPKPAMSLFGAAKPAEPSSVFGSKPAITESAAPATGSSGLSLFGQPASSQPAETTPSAAKPASLFGNATAATPSGGSLFNATSAAQAPNTSTPAPTTTQPGSIFGNANKPATGTTTAEPPKHQFGRPAASSAASEAPKPLSLFGAPSASTTSPSTATAAAPTTNTGTPASSAAAPGTTTASTTNATQKPVTSQTTSLGASTNGPTSSMARLKNKTMDEILNRWATDLSKYQKEFKEQASQVAAWDRLLVENGDKIQKLYLNTFEAEKASREVERHLVNVESQQEELESWLDKYEAEVDTLYSKQFNPSEQLTGPDQEREQTYKLAERITERLDEMGRDLTKMIKEINDISGVVSKGSKPDDPLSQIVRVLNGHLTQLQWIDTNAAALQAKVTAAQKASSQIGSQYGGPEQDNVDSFYRSYMGRR